MLLEIGADRGLFVDSGAHRRNFPVLVRPTGFRFRGQILNLRPQVHQARLQGVILLPERVLFLFAIRDTLLRFARAFLVFGEKSHQDFE